MAPTHAASIAARFLQVAADSGVTDVSNMKLQKLVVLTQSASMFAIDTPAFREPVQAWKNGPVVRPLYGLYKHFRDQPITQVAASEFSSGALTSIHDALIEEVWDVAGTLTASNLWKLTHDVGPWLAFYNKDTQNEEIPQSMLGAAWTEYVAKADLLSSTSTNDMLPVIGKGQAGYGSVENYDLAMSLFKPTSPQIRVA